MFSAPATCQRRKLRQRFQAFSNQRPKARCVKLLPANSPILLPQDRPLLATPVCSRLPPRGQHASSATQATDMIKAVCDAARHRHPRFMCHRRRKERRGHANACCGRLTDRSRMFLPNTTRSSAAFIPISAMGSSAVSRSGENSSITAAIGYLRFHLPGIPVLTFCIKKQIGQTRSAAQGYM